MMHRLFLIARREIAAYASTPSFWIALFLGPLLFLVAGLVGVLAQSPAPGSAPAAQTLVLDTPDAGLAVALRAAVDQVNRTGAATLRLLPPPGARADTRLELRPSGDLNLSVLVRGKPLPPAAASAVVQRLTTELQTRRLRRAGVGEATLAAVSAVRVNLAAAETPSVKTDDAAAARIGRFAVVMLLWMNLIGALGMLLQAIVRERTHRALEPLLASARSIEIIFGKVVGVGCLSLLVLGTWLGVAAAVAGSPFAAAGLGAQHLVFDAFKNGPDLLFAVAVYVVAFVMYGSTLIGLGALAKDLPAAQNLSRPVFGVLLLIFFLALSQLTGAVGPMTWLIWLPPVTPFVLLMAPPGSFSPMVLAGGFLLMMVSMTAAAALAAGSLSESPFAWLGRRRRGGAISV